MRDASQYGSGRSGKGRSGFAGRILAGVSLALLAVAVPLLAQDRVDSALDALVAAYPNALAGHDANSLRARRNGHAGFR